MTYSKFEDQIYLFLHLAAPPCDVVTCTHTPGGLLTARRPLSAWVSSSRTPPLLPRREKERVSSLQHHYSSLCMCHQLIHTLFTLSANFQSSSAVTDGSFINQFIQNARQRFAPRCLKCDSSIPQGCTEFSLCTLWTVDQVCKY